MSGHGAPDLAPVEGVAQLRVAVLASQWHTTVMDGLIEGARRCLKDSQVQQATELRVPGTFELTVAAARLAGQFDALVALGVVIRGDTPHFDYVCQSVTQGLTAVVERTGIPVGFGVLTCDTEKQAIARAGLPGSAEDKGYEATYAALQVARTLAEFGPAARP